MSNAFPDGTSLRAIARIDEATCIGCTLCIQACPTDAIVGAAKLMHTVIADRCTGCELCLPPCPVDCIAMLPAARVWSSADAERARQRASARNAPPQRPVRRKRGQESAAGRLRRGSDGGLRSTPHWRAPVRARAARSDTEMRETLARPGDVQ